MRSLERLQKILKLATVTLTFILEPWNSNLSNVMSYNHLPEVNEGVS